MARLISAEELFGEELIEDDDWDNRPCDCSGKGARNEALFEKVKTEMVMRIHHVSAERARQIIASAAMGAAAPDKNSAE